jgi:acetyl-CoA C-acetyltransferase
MSTVIVSFARTPIGKFLGKLSSVSAPQLGATAIKGALSKASGSPDVDELPFTIAEAYLGNVCSAGVGQAPSRQAILGAGLPESTVCTTINKVCASGMKSVMLGSQAIAAGSVGENRAILAGGMESMSNIPHYLHNSRTGTSLGNTQLIDGLVYDGLWDPYNDQHMGSYMYS